MPAIDQIRKFPDLPAFRTWKQPSASSFAGASGAADAPNPIVAENALPGATSGWNEGDWGGDRLEAFGDVLSALPGHRVGLKVSTKPSGLAYEIRVFRLGWYGGAGMNGMCVLIVGKKTNTG